MRHAVDDRGQRHHDRQQDADHQPEGTQLGHPSGSPDEDTFETPYANTGGGRMLIFCAEGETLITLSMADGTLELTCVPTAQ